MLMLAAMIKGIITQGTNGGDNSADINTKKCGRCYQGLKIMIRVIISDYFRINLRSNI